MTGQGSLHSPRELMLDRAVHCAGLGAGPIAVAAMIWSSWDRGATIAIGVLIYATGLLAMLGCSALYHLSRAVHRKALFRRLDHAAIFLLIAGTYTPFALHTIGGPRGAGLLAFVWAVAVIGIVFKLLRPGVLERASIVVYVLLGWSGLAMLGPLLTAASSRTLALLALGGLLYTVGVLFHVWKRLPYQNAIWHALVLAGASCHYAAVLSAVAF